MKRMRCVSLVCLFTLIASMGMMSDGCTGPDFSSLAGLWSIERGGISVKFTFTVADGGEVTQNAAEDELEPLDPADFPEELADLVAQWNNGLGDLNLAIDEAVPDRVIVTFPGPFQMKIQNPDDAAKAGTGLINENAQYGFAAILGGGGQGSEQGAGGVLDVSSIEGSFDVAARTTEGKIVRRLIVALIGNNSNGVSFVAEISVSYTGEWIDEVPTDDNANDNNTNGNANSNENENGNKNNNSNDNGNGLNPKK